MPRASKMFFKNNNINNKREMLARKKIANNKSIIGPELYAFLLMDANFGLINYEVAQLSFLEEV